MTLVFRLYQLIVSPALHLLAGPGYGCRHTPSCSRYAEARIRERGIWRGGWLALRRLLSCHPFSK